MLRKTALALSFAQDPAMGDTAAYGLAILLVPVLALMLGAEASREAGARLESDAMSAIMSATSCSSRIPI
jgi:hypothetical protein